MHSLPLDLTLLPACATTASLAFANDDVFAFLRPFRHQYPGRLRDYFIRMLRSDLHMPGCAIRVIVSDDTDDWWDERVGSEVLGFALWERVGKEAFDGEAWGKDGWMKRFERNAAKAETRYVSFFHLDPSYDYHRLQAYNAALTNKINPIHEALNNHQEHIWLSFLGVHPRYQRRGIGKRLLKWGIERSNTERVPIGLAASPDGASLYMSVGFQDLGPAVLNGDGWRIEDRAMVRWPDGEGRKRRSGI